MKNKILPLLTALCLAFNVLAATVVRDYTGLPLSEALADFSKKNMELKISFIYDELENYRVKGKIRSQDPLQAIKELVALNPISVTTDGDEIYVQPMQKGKYRYTGRTVSKDSGEPVGFATVVLLTPKDSTALTYGVTDENGNFSIPCDRKNIIVKLSSVGHRTKYIDNPSYAMGDIKMEIFARNLQDVVTTSDSRYALSDHTVYVPSAREKKAAQDATQLLQFMAIPSIYVNPVNNSVTTLSGKGVVAFIDYVKASSEELNSLHAEDVKKVEIYDYPVDPRFEGTEHVVNFIMVKYEYGGYTKLFDGQRMDFNYGYYSLSSKFSYGKMTYDVYTGYDHFKARDEYTDNVNIYDFDSSTVEQKDLTTKSLVETNEAYLSTRAKYSTDKTVISNQLSIRRNDTPDSYNIGQNIYSPAIYPSGESEQIMKRRTLNPSWKGNFQFFLPSSMQLVLSPSLSYSRNTSSSIFLEDAIEINNDVKEDAWGANMNVSLSKSWSPHTLTVSVAGELNDNKLAYTGNSPADIHYNVKALGAFLRGSFRFGKLRLQPSVKFFFSKTSFGEEKYNQPLPGYYVSGGINFNRKHQLSFSSEMSHWTIGASQRSPNIVVRSLIDAVQGNPNLKTWLYNSADFSYTWLPRQWLNFSVFGNYIRHTKPMDYLFVPTYIDGREMMLRTYIKDGYFQTISGGLSVVVRLFDNSLTLRGNGQLTSNRRGGRRNYERLNLNGNLSAYYFLGNFYFNGSYEFKEKTATVNYEKIDRPSYYSLGAGWSNKGWNISMSFRNFYRKSKLKGVQYMAYENFRSTEQIFGAAYSRSMWVNITYTIGYGKKIKEENIDRGKSNSSGIVR